jgi:predicted transcriptional regulator
MHNDMYDDTMQQLQQFGRDFEEFMRIMDRLSGKKSPPTAELPETDVTGKFTDIAKVDGIDKNVLDSLDPTTKENLLKNLERAEKQGLIEVDFKNKKVNLTEKGKDYIKNPEFQKELKLDQMKFSEAGQTELVGIELTGTDEDLLFFNTNETLDLNAIDFSKSNPELSEKFAENIKKWQEDGLVQVGEDMKLSLTEKGKNFIKTPEFLNQFGGVKQLAEKALSAIPHGKIAVAIKKIVSAVMKTAKATNTASNVLGGG